MKFLSTNNYLLANICSAIVRVRKVLRLGIIIGVISGCAHRKSNSVNFEKPNFFGPPAQVDNSDTNCPITKSKAIKNLFFDIKFSDKICDPLAAKIESNFEKFFEYKRGPRPNPIFARMFPGKNFEGVALYLSERIHFFSVRDLESNRNTSETYPEFARRLDQQEPSSVENLTAALWAIWVRELIRGNHIKSVSVDGFEIAFSRSMNTRIGLIRLKSSGVSMDDLSYLNYFVHEARHSDCTNGGYKFVEYKSGDAELKPVSDKADKLLCFHRHYKCRSLSGLNESTCDQIPWGSHTFSYVFNRELLMNCTNCSFAPRQLKLNMLASLYRMNFLPKDLYKKSLALYRAYQKEETNSETNAKLNADLENTFAETDSLLWTYIDKLDLSSSPLIQ